MKSKYLQLLQLTKTSPNFWCAEEYFEKTGLVEKQCGDWTIVEDPRADNMVVFPPINTNQTTDLPPDVKMIWSDFPGCQFVGYSKNFLDFEYIYDPALFKEMTGSSWAVFRKNSRKFPQRFPGSIYIEPEMKHESSILRLIRNWAEQKSLEDLWDFETLVQYAKYGENRRILVEKDGWISGLNIWDENWAQINFRFCICELRDFLSEYMRLLFYTDPSIIKQQKMVNDGGILGNPSLQSFKDKLNPVSIRKIYSWRKI